MRFNGIDISAMFPYKVVSKKSAKLSKGSLKSDSTVCLPVAMNEEYCCQSQMAVMVELLLNNKQTIIKHIEGDLEDTSKPLFSEFPSILRILQENDLLHLYLKDYRASALDEYDELMSNVPALMSHRSQLERVGNFQDYQESEEDDSFSVRHDSSASVDSYENVLDNESGPELMVLRNNRFLGLPAGVSYCGSRAESEAQLDGANRYRLCSRKLIQWIEDSSDDKNCLFDSDYQLLTCYGLLASPYDIFSKMFSNPGQQLVERSKPHRKSKEFFLDEGGVRAAKGATEVQRLDIDIVPARKASQFDYTYYEYRIEKACADEIESVGSSTNIATGQETSHQKSRDDHHEVEVSTKSEELPEEILEQNTGVDADVQPAIEETKQLSKAAKKKMKKQNKLAQAKVIVAVEASPCDTDRAKRSKDIAEPVPVTPEKIPAAEEPVKSIEPAYYHTDSFNFDPEKERLKQKEQERLKQDSKDYLKDLLAKIYDTPDLDEFEKDCTTQINSLDSLTKKMKQKARRRLRQEVDDEKAKRKLLEEKQMEEENDDDFEDERRSIFEEFQSRYKDVLSPESLSREFFNDRPNLELIKNFCR